MTFSEWAALAPQEQDAVRKEWQVFEPGYWHTLADQATRRFAKEFGGDSHLQRICKSLYHSDELIIALQTDCADGNLLPLPENYLGFRVVQFANKTPEGVLVDVAPIESAG